MSDMESSTLTGAFLWEGERRIIRHFSVGIINIRTDCKIAG